MKQGILHALYGKLAEAEKVFSAAQAKDPSMVSPYVNLANLRIIDHDLDGAITTLRAGLTKVSDRAQIFLQLARCYAAKGDAQRTAEYLAELRKVSPDLAERNADLAAQPQGSSGRGSFNGGFEPSFWSSQD